MVRWQIDNYGNLLCIFRAYELQILFTFCYQEQKWHHQSGIDDNSCWSTEIQGVQFSTKSIGYFKLLVYLCNTYVQHMYQRIVLVGNILTYILDVVLLPVSVSNNFSSLNHKPSLLFLGIHR